MSQLTHDVALVGAGPIGLEIAVALKRARVNYLHLDGGQVGQTIYNFAPQTRFFSSNERIAIAGVPLQTPDQAKCTRENYLSYLRSIVQMFDLNVHTHERIASIDRNGDRFELATTRFGMQRQYTVHKLILATGGTAAARKLGIPGEEQENVHHGFHDPHLYFRNRLLIVGGRNSAVEAALRSYHTGASVGLSYRRAAFDPEHIKYWLYPEITGLIKAGQIAGHFNTVPARISGDCVTLRNTSTGELASVQTDFLLVLIGFNADMRLAQMAGVRLEGERQMPHLNPQTMETNVPGVFMAGTATAGTQDQYSMFIENCHNHAQRIVAAITGRPVGESTPETFARPET